MYMMCHWAQYALSTICIFCTAQLSTFKQNIWVFLNFILSYPTIVLSVLHFQGALSFFLIMTFGHPECGRPKCHPHDEALNLQWVEQCPSNGHGESTLSHPTFLTFQIIEIFQHSLFHSILHEIYIRWYITWQYYSNYQDFKNFGPILTFHPVQPTFPIPK